MTPEAFEALVRPFRRELAAHCYRMLGSIHDAEDQVQETLLSAWRGIDGFEGRSSVRGWLYKIATNRCLDEIRRRPRHGLPPERGEPGDPLAPLPPAGELLWVEPCPPGMWEGAPSAEATLTCWLPKLYGASGSVASCSDSPSSRLLTQATIAKNSGIQTGAVLETHPSRFNCTRHDRTSGSRKQRSPPRTS